MGETAATARAVDFWTMASRVPLSVRSSMEPETSTASRAWVFLAAAFQSPAAFVRAAPSASPATRISP